MKVVAFNTSPRKDGNTALMLKEVIGVLEKEGVECELIQFAGERITGCRACYKCKENMDKKCIIKDDNVNEYIGKMLEADGIIIGSPTYFANVTAECKALIDRAGVVARANGNIFKRKVGAAVTAVRRAGSIHAFNSINHFFTIGEMIVPGSTYWNLAVGKQIGDVSEDEEGMQTMRDLGENMAWLLKKIG